MKKMIFLFVTLLVTFGHISAQNIPGVPNGSIGKDTRDDYDNGIRIRSIELERIKDESYRSAIVEKTTENRKINYSQIKKDFESVQKLQSQIVKIYITGKTINYRRISELASNLNESAKRLDDNLLLCNEKTENKSKKKNSDPEDVKNLIVILDKLIGNFVTNPVFQNLNIIETKNSNKAELELQNIIRLSDSLAQQAEKQM